MKFVVTGATSMIGVSFIDAAIKQGHEVLAIVRKDSNKLYRIPQSNLIRFEYSDLEHLSEIPYDGRKYDVLYHFAWDYTNREGRNNVEGQEKNILYTLNAVKLANAFGVDKFIGVGSQSEYGVVDKIINKSTPYNPQMPYAMAKVSAYWLSKELCKQFDIKHYWGRVFSVYGNYDHEGTLLTYAIDSFIKGDKAFFSSGEHMWNYLHEKDAGRMFLELGIKQLNPDVYFIAHPESKPLKYYLEILISVFGEEVKYEFACSKQTSSYGIYPCMEEENELLDFVPLVSFEDGIKDMIEYRRRKTKR